MQFEHSDGIAICEDDITWRRTAVLQDSRKQLTRAACSRVLPSNGVVRLCLGRVSRSGWRSQPRAGRERVQEEYVNAAARDAVFDLAHFLLCICIPLRNAVPCTILLLLQCHTPCTYPKYSSPTSELPQSTTPHSDVHPQQRAATRLTQPSQVLPRACRFARHTATRRDIPLPALINTALAAGSETTVNSTHHRSSHGTLSSLRP